MWETIWPGLVYTNSMFSPHPCAHHFPRTSQQLAKQWIWPVSMCPAQCVYICAQKPWPCVLHGEHVPWLCPIPTPCWTKPMLILKRGRRFIFHATTPSNLMLLLRTPWCPPVILHFVIKSSPIILHFVISLLWLFNLWCFKLLHLQHLHYGHNSIGLFSFGTAILAQWKIFTSLPLMWPVDNTSAWASDIVTNQTFFEVAWLPPCHAE